MAAIVIHKEERKIERKKEDRKEGSENEREKRGDREIGGKGEGGKEEERLHTGCQETLFSSDFAAELQNILEQDSQPL